MRSLAAASPRVKVFTMGMTEEGREMLCVAVSDEENIKNLDHYKEINAKLADPRKTTPAEAEKLIAEAKPMYWASGSIHSPETGSPEMLMELAYRLAVEESPFIQSIRKNDIVLITPLVEADGHDREVDSYSYRKANPGKPASPFIYWGKYVAHDNNRDGMGMGLALTRNMMKNFLEYHPTILHDLARPHRGGRVADPGLQRDRGNDQAWRSRRMDARLLRRLGPELHVLHRQRAQRHRPLL
jgi:hypothetical protein